MTPAALLALVLVLQALPARSAQAATFAECQAFLCLPGGFPPSECNAAQAAVLRRLRAFLPALPSWSSCAAAFGWDAANLTHTEHPHADCPRGGVRSGNLCRYTAPDGCTWSYTARQRVTVQVIVDGATNFQPNHTLTHTQRPAGPSVLDPGQGPLRCGGAPPPPPPPPPAPPPTGVCCPPHTVNHYWHGPATAPTKTLVCTPTPTSPQPPGDPPPQRTGEPYNPPNCCPPWALHHQWAYDRNSLVCVLGGILPN